MNTHTFEHPVFLHYDLSVFIVTISRLFSFQTPVKFEDFSLKKTIVVPYDLLDNFHYEHPVFLTFD
jgi:hypothetical protein